MPLDEFSLIRRYFSQQGSGAAVGLAVGDDCAILELEPGERLATSVDTMVEGVHFPSETAARHVAWRAVGAAASDLAAMGARPLGMTLALTLPQADEEWLQGFSEGMAAVSTHCDLPLVGGDTTRGPLTVTVQVLGGLPPDRALLRSGAAVGDRVCVSGTLGDAAAALAVLSGEWRPAPGHTRYLLERFNRPAPRLALGRSLLGRASAAIDVSDGLLADAGHIAEASAVRLCLDTGQLPLSGALRTHPETEQPLRWALTGGDDYELCFCLPPGETLPAGCTVVGRVEAGAGVDCGARFDFPGGYTHF